MADDAADRRNRAARATRSLLLALAATLSAAASPAQDLARCVALKQQPVQALEAILLAVDDQPGWLADLAARAAARWNDPSCNRHGGFPRIVFEQPQTLFRRVRVRWVEGLNSHNPMACATFRGAEIVLYGHTLDPWTGALGDCGSVERLVETLAHEIGHVLGLSDNYDAACYGVIMSQLVWMEATIFLPRAVSPQECTAAELAFETASDRSRRAGDAIVLASVAAPVESSDQATAQSLVTRSELGPSLRPRSVRIAPDSPATVSDGYHP